MYVSIWTGGGKVFKVNNSNANIDTSWLTDSNIGVVGDRTGFTPTSIQFNSSGDMIIASRGIGSGKYSGIFKRASGQTDVVKVAGSGAESTSAAESLTDPLSVSVGYPKSIAVDSVDDVFIMTMFKAGNMTQGGLYVLSDTYTDYSQIVGTHQRLTIANDKVNPFGGVINISNE